MKTSIEALVLAAAILAAPPACGAETVKLHLGETLEGNAVEITAARLKAGKLPEQCFLRFKDRTMYVRAVEGRKLSGVYLILDKIPREEIAAESGRYSYAALKNKIYLTLYNGTFYGAGTHRQHAVTHIFDKYYTELKVSTSRK